MPRRQPSTSTAIHAALLAIASSGAIAKPQQQFTFDLPAEPLSRALRDVAVHTGRNVIAPGRLVESRQAPPLAGTFSAEGAIGRLLHGSDLQVRFIGDDLVVEAAVRQSAAGVSTADNSESITVTGTRIRGVGSTSPVIVATRRELEQSGISTLADFTRVLPQNYTGGQNPGIAGNNEQGGQTNLNNSAALNLRGLGPDATLTLLNGHRLSYDSVYQGTDIAAIPLGAIDRIEVVGDGASALYGSDAVAGVANIILRRDYDGFEATARVGGATDGGDVQQEYSLVGGRRWSGGGFMIAVDESSATPITAAQRDYTRYLDPSLFLTDRTRQQSGVLSVHQHVTPTISFALDGNAMERKSLVQDPYSPTKDVHVTGLVDHSEVTSYALTPTVKADVRQWQLTLSGTMSDSRTFLDAQNYYNSVGLGSRILYEDNLKGVEGTGEGPVLALPAGDARLALGGGLRTIWFHDRQLNQSGGQYVTHKNFTETRNVQFVYGELSLPLVGPDLNVPLIDRLSLSAALRHEHWNRIGSVTTPKLGVIYEPSRDVSVRATWGKSFKIPTLYEINQPESAGLYAGSLFTPPSRPAGSTVLIVAGSAPNLKPERATSWSVTAELKPRVIRGLDLRATYFHVDYRDRIAKPFNSGLTALYNPLYASLITYNPTPAQVNAAIASVPAGFYNISGAPFDAANVGAIMDASSRNTERQRIHGVDLNGDYRVDLANGRSFTLTGAASYLQSKQQLVAGQVLLPLAGTIFNPPHWRGRGGATWESRHAALSGFVNYLGTTIDNTFTSLETVPPFVTLDLAATLRTASSSGPLRNVELRLSAMNVLNEKPHRIRNQYPEAAPYDSTNESPVGRFVGASLRKVW